VLINLKYYLKPSMMDKKRAADGCARLAISGKTKS